VSITEKKTGLNQETDQIESSISKKEEPIMNADTNTINSRIIPAEKLLAITSKIGRDVSFEGNFLSADPNAGLHLEGRFQGAIRFENGGVIHVGAGAVISKGQIVADHIFIEGTFEGDLHARKSLEITGTGVVSGSILYDENLDLHAGARMKATMEFSGDMGERGGKEVKVAEVPVEAPQAIEERTLPGGRNFAEETSRVLNLQPFGRAVA
jgi:cytoskeletal protein CcmA (bactofilin family)